MLYAASHPSHITCGYPPTIRRCWIESKQSQKFRICWRFMGSTPHCIKSYIWLDGVQVSGGLLRSHEVHHTFRMSGCAIESNKRLPFVFGKQQLTGASHCVPTVSFIPSDLLGRRR
jgi:hypothetical protein